MRRYSSECSRFPIADHLDQLNAQPRLRRLHSPWLHGDSTKVYGTAHLTLNTRFEQVSHAHTGSTRRHNYVSLFTTTLERVGGLAHGVPDDSKINDFVAKTLQYRDQRRSVRVDNGRKVVTPIRLDFGWRILQVREFVASRKHGHSRPAMNLDLQADAVRVRTRVLEPVIQKQHVLSAA